MKEEHRKILGRHMISAESHAEISAEESGAKLPLPSREELIEEYKEAGELHRLQIGLLFGQITVYLGISGGLFSVFFDQQRAPKLVLDIGVPVAGILLTVFFFIISERAGDYSHAARKRAVQIQNQIGLSLYMENARPAALWGVATAINAVRGIYLLGFVAWLVASLDCM